MRKIIVAALLVSLIAVAAFKKRDHGINIPKGWPAPVHDVSREPVTAKKVLLGRMLFYDPILSRDSTISCAGCHASFTAFAHTDHNLSHGIDGRIGTRNAPALMNLAWNKQFMWDGSVAHLDEQAIRPITDPREMDETMAHIITKLQHSDRYPRLFHEAFGNSAVDQKKVLSAISQFMLTLVCANSKYDSVMRNEAKFTPQETNGYRLFRQHCAACHTEPLFTNSEYENNGLPVDTALNDIGRMKVTGKPEDSLKFKVPGLRNIEFSYPYMHDGRFKRLSEIVKHYTSGIQQSNTLSTQLRKPIVLSSDERVDLTAFLLTLTDRSFLFDPCFAYPKDNFSKLPKD